VLTNSSFCHPARRVRSDRDRLSFAQGFSGCCSEPCSVQPRPTSKQSNSVVGLEERPAFRHLPMASRSSPDSNVTICIPLQCIHMMKSRDRHSNPDLDAKPLLIDAMTAATLCGRSLRTWRSWNASGRIPESIRIGRSIMWRLDEIQAWVEAGCPTRKDWTFTAKTQRRLT
jgi:predicted DNA-binding transcriptional regulator AlpA